MNKIYEYKNTIFYIIQKNKRRINAYARQNLIRRIKVFIMLILILCTSVQNTFAIENDKISYGDYQIFCKKDPYMYIKYNGKMQPNYEYYYVRDGKNYPAYCLNLGFKGAEDCDNNGYNVYGNEKITDEKLKVIILNSYPYKTVEELELNNEDEAIFASQFAMWCYLNNLDLNLIEPISSMNEKIVSVIKSIYYKGLNETIDEKDVNLNFNFSNQITEEINGKRYYSKTMEIQSKNINNIELSLENNEIKLEKLSSNKYKFSIPVEIVKSTYKSDFNVKINAKENVVLFGKTKLSGFQNMAITLKNQFDTDIKGNIEFTEYNSKIIITKKDKDTGVVIPNTQYSIEFEDDGNAQQYTTNNDGKIEHKLNNSNIVKLKIKEIKANENYRIDNNEYIYEIAPNSEKNIQLYNEKKKGIIEVIKRTKEYNKVTNLPENSPLKDVEFEILDENKNIVNKIITDELGYAKTKELPIGKYYIRETKTSMHYKVLSDELEVELVEDNQKATVNVLNENAYYEDKLPVTGR